MIALVICLGVEHVNSFSHAFACTASGRLEVTLMDYHAFMTRCSVGVIPKPLFLRFAQTIEQNHSREEYCNVGFCFKKTAYQQTGIDTKRAALHINYSHQRSYFNY